MFPGCGVGLVRTSSKDYNSGVFILIETQCRKKKKRKKERKEKKEKERKKRKKF
jgi:hypothetical protein